MSLILAILKASVSLILAILKASVALIRHNPVFNFIKNKNPTFKSKISIININKHN